MRRPVAVLTALLAALALGACGNKEEETLHGINEGSYLDLGELKYQVQISRILNQDHVEDQAYLIGVDPAQRRLRPGDHWFAVFIRVENGSDEAHPAARDFRIADTQENVFRPVALAPQNVFAFRSRDVPPRSRLPVPDSVADQSSIQGSLLLFKIPNANLENRPLEFSVRDPSVSDEVATVDLDV
jgi:hypothetical protein